MIIHMPLILLFSLFVQSPWLVFSVNPPFACDPSDPATQQYAFCKPTLSIKQRTHDLMSRLTLDEKIAQLGDIAPPITRLGVPGYQWWSESLHGVSSGGRGIHFDGPIKAATSFPQVILTAATFNPLLWYQIGQVIGKEARALYNAGQAEGLTFWSPNINIFRDPRWGRGQETPGEDPLTTSIYAASYVKGLQGSPYQGGYTPQVLQASACCKHFTAYDLENWEGIVRDSFNAEVSAQDLEDTFQPPFKSCIEEGHASGIMCSYNQVNGVPNCANYTLLTQTARGRWKFNGYITSDCDAVADIYEAQNYTKTPEDAVAYTIKAGMDLNCGNYVQNYARNAIQQGKLTEADLDRALQNLFSVRMWLGLFDGNPNRYPPYGSIRSDQVCSQDHQNLALQAALDGIVLLKNTESVLPLLKSQVSSLAVIGPNANNFTVLLGNYAGPPCKITTPLMGLQSYAKDTRYLAGCQDVACNSSSIDQAVQLASSVDYVVMFMGLDQSQETEALDRIDLVLPGMQRDLITSVAKAAKKPVILVLICGGPVDIDFVKSNPKIGAVLWAGYPGQAGGTAIAQILFGEHNPGGKLPTTWYPQEFTRFPMSIMRMRAGPSNFIKDHRYPGRTYRFYKGYSVFQFGYGLSYSNYSHEIVTQSDNQLLTKTTINLHTMNIDKNLDHYHIEEIGSEACKSSIFPVVVRVKNHGPMDGRHTVLMFMRWPKELNGRPTKQLIGFNSVYLKAGEVGNVKFIVSPCKHLSRATEDGKWVIDKGSHFLMVEEDELEINVSS
ncbi:hypothetical protein LUZ63_004720 [Rhynchospora breviuscula]|uniref:Fibronectin type III-like domain-containing protein n=1 Tax=Rhynchospora breviuscula TaxID=2022672 RepID=A0A9Q0HSF3_9POAL|nr:hypothetical protein LUZ63_004720 [Rhynchospora breviuscula]